MTTSPEPVPFSWATLRLGVVVWGLALACSATAAATFRGLVTHVTDGDTVWVQPSTGGADIELRLLHLDAPEGCQLYGAESKKALARRVLRQRVVVRTQGVDDYQRSLARLRHRGDDVGAWMVREGHAWSTNFQGRPGPYEKLEAQARKQRRGLWAGAAAQDPRSFRRRNGRCQ